MHSKIFDCFRLKLSSFRLKLNIRTANTLEQVQIFLQSSSFCLFLSKTKMEKFTKLYLINTVLFAIFETYSLYMKKQTLLLAYFELFVSRINKSAQHILVKKTRIICNSNIG